MPRRAPARDTRIEMRVPQAVRERLEALVVNTGAANMTEVFRRALALYECVTEVKAEGGELLIRNASGELERLRVL